MCAGPVNGEPLQKDDRKGEGETYKDREREGEQKK